MTVADEDAYLGGRHIGHGRLRKNEFFQPHCRQFDRQTGVLVVFSYISLLL